MSADSPRRSSGNASRGVAAVPAIVPPQVVSDRSILDSAIGFINEVTLAHQPLQDPKDTITWARFETTADISDPRFGEDWELEGNVAPPLLLILGYGLGVQVWAIPANGEAVEVLSWRHGIVSALRFLPTPVSFAAIEENGRADEPNDVFAEKRPLLALVDGSPSSGSQPQFCAVNFISLKTGTQVKTIKFKNPVIDILANRSSIVITFHERIAVFDARTLEDRLSITTCYPSPGINPNPVALGPRWLAYAENKLLHSKRSGGGCDGDGVASYTATVLNASKSLVKGLRELGEQVAAGLTGTTGSAGNSKNVSFDSGCGPDAKQPGIITIVDIKNPFRDQSPTSGVPVSNNQFAGMDAIIAHFIAHSEALVAMEFDNSGMLLVTADRRGHDFHVFRIQPNPVGPSLAAVHHLYILHRGDTSAKVQNITLSLDSRWVAVSTLRGTTHVFPITPYGGAMGVRTHTSLHVVNKLSRFHRSAGLSAEGRSNSPISHSESTTFTQSLQPYHNPTLPPFPRPTVVMPLAQLRQPFVLGSPPGSATLVGVKSVTGSSGSGSQRQRLSSLSDDSGKPLSVCAIFAKSRSWLLDPPNVTREAPHRMQRKAVDSLFVMAGHGALIQYDLDTKLASNVAKEKICDDTPIELEVEAKAQWNLGRRKEGSQEIMPPLAPDNWLIKNRNSCVLTDSTRQYDELDDRGESWLAQVEIITHAGPHRRLWMGPQFVFKTYNIPSGSNLNHVDIEAVEIGTSKSTTAATSEKLDHTSPLNMPLTAAGRSSAVPVLIESGSYSSIEQSPKLMDRFRHEHLDSDFSVAHGDSRLKEDLADAMRESPSVAASSKDTGGHGCESAGSSDNVAFYDALTAQDDQDYIQARSASAAALASALPNIYSYDNSSSYESLDSIKKPKASIEKIVNPLGTVTTVTSCLTADVKTDILDEVVSQLAAEDTIIHENCDESLFRPVVAIFCDEKTRLQNEEEIRKISEHCQPPESISSKLVVPVIAKEVDDELYKREREKNNVIKSKTTISKNLKTREKMKSKFEELSLLNKRPKAKEQIECVDKSIKETGCEKNKSPILDKNGGRKQHVNQGTDTHKTDCAKKTEIGRKLTSDEILNCEADIPTTQIRSKMEELPKKQCEQSVETPKEFTNMTAKHDTTKNELQKSPNKIVKVFEENELSEKLLTFTNNNITEEYTDNLSSKRNISNKLKNATTKPKGEKANSSDTHCVEISDHKLINESVNEVNEKLIFTISREKEETNFSKIKAQQKRKIMGFEPSSTDDGTLISKNNVSAESSNINKTIKKEKLKKDIVLIEASKSDVKDAIVTAKTNVSKLVENSVKCKIYDNINKMNTDQQAESETTVILPKSNESTKKLNKNSGLCDDDNKCENFTKIEELKKANQVKEIQPKVAKHEASCNKDNTELKNNEKSIELKLPKKENQLLNEENLTTDVKNIKSDSNEKSDNLVKANNNKKKSSDCIKVIEENFEENPQIIKPIEGDKTKSPNNQTEKEIEMKSKEFKMDINTTTNNGNEDKFRNSIFKIKPMKVEELKKKNETISKKDADECSNTGEEVVKVNKDNQLKEVTTKNNATKNNTLLLVSPKKKQKELFKEEHTKNSDFTKKETSDFITINKETNSEETLNKKVDKMDFVKNVIAKEVHLTKVMTKNTTKNNTLLPSSSKNKDKEVSKNEHVQNIDLSKKEAYEKEKKSEEILQKEIVAKVDSDKKDIAKKDKSFLKDDSNNITWVGRTANTGEKGKKQIDKTQNSLTMDPQPPQESAWKTLSGAEMIAKNLSKSDNDTESGNFPSLSIKSKSNSSKVVPTLNKLLPELSTPSDMEEQVNLCKTKNKSKISLALDEFTIMKPLSSLPPLPPLEPLKLITENKNSNTVRDISLINFESPLQESLALQRKITPAPRGFTEQNLIFALCGSLHYEHEQAHSSSEKAELSPTLSSNRSSTALEEPSTADYKSLTENDDPYMSLEQSSQDTNTTNTNTTNDKCSSSTSSSGSEEIIIMEEKKMTKKQKRKRQQQLQELQKQKEKQHHQQEMDDEELRPLINMTDSQIDHIPSDADNTLPILMAESFSSKALPTQTLLQSTTTDSEGPMPATTSDDNVYTIPVTVSHNPNKIKTKKLEHKFNLIAAIEAATSSSTSSAEESSAELGSRSAHDNDESLISVAGSMSTTSSPLPNVAIPQGTVGALKKKTKRRKR